MRVVRGGAAGLLLLLACSSRLPHPVYSAHTTAELVPVPYPPPPPRVEEIPPRPSGDALWIDGEWGWRRKKWTWRPGRWAAPAPGTTYSPWTVTRDEAGTLYFAPGTWRDASGQPVAHGTPP